MEIGTVLEYLAPGNHTGLEVIICRTRTVINHLCSTHTCRWLEVIGAYTLSAVEHTAGINTQLCQIHCSGMPHRGVWQTGDISHLLALSSQRYSHVGLAAAILAGKHISLRQS